MVTSRTYGEGSAVALATSTSSDVAAPSEVSAKLNTSAAERGVLDVAVSLLVLSIGAGIGGLLVVL